MSLPLLRPCLAVSLLLLHSPVAAQDQLKIAIGQRGGWEQCVSELGQNAESSTSTAWSWKRSTRRAAARRCRS